MQLNKADNIAMSISKELRNYFNNRVDNISIYNTTDIPYTMFSMSFKAYDYFIIILNYDRGRFGCAIDGGSAGISLKNSQQWYDKADMDVFLQELEQQIELRIPDKFLEYHGWK
ncbi:hypothetical protein [Pseudogracilibacillus sp. SO30301A]|uniref:hypothetical protein n=1 Tax=Pseudogracilibacillus sp. SO30301A TaxID=3098291 RepID=UPI00300DEC51